MQTYKKEKDLTQALTHLAKSDKTLASAFREYGTPPMRKAIGGFPGLVQLLVSQQVSTAAAATIFRRFEEAVGTLEPQNLLALDEATLSGCGISRPKQRYLRILAEAVLNEELDFKKLDRGDNATIYDSLVAITGIGPWTAQCYLLFVLCRADMFPSGDLALQEATKLLYGLKTRPDAAELAEFAERWAPYRGAAARLLWTYYNGEQAKKRAARG